MKNTFPETFPKEIAPEVRTLRENHAEIIRNVGKFVLIHGSSIVDYFKSYREALNAGYEQFGLQEFLVRFVKKQDTPIRVMRFRVARMGHKLRLARTKASLRRHS
jgi:hypothetical protein